MVCSGREAKRCHSGAILVLAMIFLVVFSALGACRRIRSGFERPFFRLAASGCIDDKTNIACFAVFARRKNCSLSGRRRNSPTDS